LYSFIHKNPGALLDQSNVPLVAPGRKGTGRIQVLETPKPAFLEFPLDSFGTLKPSVIVVGNLFASLNSFNKAG